MNRPPPPVLGLEEGGRYEVFVAPAPTTGWHCWTTDPAIVRGRLCRRGDGRPAVAALDRSNLGGRPLWYGYCDNPAHLYGRWIEDGKVVEWRLRRVG